MVHIVKVSLCGPANKVVEIRRAVVNTEIMSSYNALCERMNSLFPQIAGKIYNLGWNDKDGDFITVSSDAEIAQAIANEWPDGIIRLSICLRDSCETFSPIKSSKKNEDRRPEHSSFYCDVCNVPISGIRYACMVCPDYDICSSCNAQDKHPHHNMFKHVNQKAVPGPLPFTEYKIFKTDLGTNLGSIHVQNMEQIAQSIHETLLKQRSAATKTGSKLPKGDIYETSKNVLSEAQEKVARSLENLAQSLACQAKTGPELPKDEESLSMVDGWTLLQNMNEEAIKRENDCAGGPNKEETQVKECQTEKDKELKTEGLQAEKKEEAKAEECQMQKKEELKAEGLQAEKKEEVKECQTEKKEELKAEGLQAEKKKETKAEECQMQKKDENIMCNESQAEADQKQAQPPRDPVLEEALSKMQRMGFSNDGGWLENLLRTRQGNISAVLDVLYPNTSEGFQQ